MAGRSKLDDKIDPGSGSVMATSAPTCAGRRSCACTTAAAAVSERRPLLAAAVVIVDERPVPRATVIERVSPVKLEN